MNTIVGAYHKMKVVAFNGSPRAQGNTYTLLRTVLDELETYDIETELVQLGSKALQGCVACRKCFEKKNFKCALDHDLMNTYIEKILQADGVLLGSPVYCANMSTNLKALIERASYVAKANADMFKGKVGASVVAVRRCGASHVFSSINYFFLISQMIIPGSSYWNMSQGWAPGDVQDDREGMKTMVQLGKNMAALMQQIKMGESV